MALQKHNHGPRRTSSHTNTTGPKRQKHNPLGLHSLVMRRKYGESAMRWSVEAQVFEERVDLRLSNDMTGRQMIAVGVRRVVLARGELDRRLEGPRYPSRLRV